MSGKKKRPDPTPFQYEGLLMPLLTSPPSLFRYVLKLALWDDRDKACRSCGDEFRAAPHMHEGIISRAEVSGWPKRWRILIHCELNCVLLHPG